MRKKFPTYPEVFGKPGKLEIAIAEQYKSQVKAITSTANEITSKVVQTAKKLQKSKNK